MEQSNQEFLKELNKNLLKPIKPSWRVQSFSTNKAKAVVIPYLDKNDVLNHLDKYAVYGWHRDHFQLGQDVYCKIGIVLPDSSVQWKADAGASGSNIEVEKSRASDSFKRAGAAWGIGRNLSDTETVVVNSNLPKVKGQPDPWVVDGKGNRVYNLTKFIQDQIDAGTLKLENLQEVVESEAENTPVETKAPAKKKPEPVKPAEELPEKPASALQPSESFDKPEAKAESSEDLDARKIALDLYLKKDQSKVLAYIIKGKKITKYATVTDFVNQHDLKVVREIYSEINKTI